jgi:hypothetical protein
MIRAGGFEEALPLIVIDVDLEQASAAPDLDRGGYHVESLRDLGGVQHARRAEALVSAAQAVLPSEPPDGPGAEGVAGP